MSHTALQSRQLPAAHGWDGQRPKRKPRAEGSYRAISTQVLIWLILILGLIIVLATATSLNEGELVSSDARLIVSHR